VSCDLLPETGHGAGVDLILLLAIACLIAGTMLVLMGRRPRGGPTVLLQFLLLGTVTTIMTLAAASPVEATTPGCSSSSPSFSSSSVGRLTVTQTSTMAAMAPGVAPAHITGRLVNDSEESAHVTAVGVEIASITTTSNSAGACGAGDYQLIAARMPVGRTLGPGASTAFAGASIGFNDRQDTNQDACKGATVHLHYTANPS